MRELSVKSLLLVLLSFVMMYFLLLQFHQFKVWSQVLVYNDLNWEDVYYLSNDGIPANSLFGMSEEQVAEAIAMNDSWLNPHLVRSLLVRPFILLSGALQINLNLIFSIAAVCYLLIASLLTFFALPFSKRNILSALFIFSFFYLVAFFMNGRLTHAFVAASLLLFTMTYFNRLPLFYIIGLVMCALFFATVSSGIFFFLFCYATLCPCMLTYRKSDPKKIAILLGIVVSFSSLYLFQIIHKVIAYYKENLVDGLLLHGAGQLAFTVSFSQCILVVVSAIPLVYLGCKKREVIWRWLVNNCPSFLMVLIGLGGCVVGFSAIAIAIPSSCVLSISLILPQEQIIENTV
ncbi:hypothetical protein [Halodesulfovibrio marinisediminis]|uniref:Uncharacterized protein n=1 Tax=Halodesulfovibrio marinisediminis DSM 17456 TaxID=1121457 RepID=A0A1N6FTQ1_9BACT|nr:hypothetical protein [Halodesulfovibrio marinisediminis]SIN98716.1 hypothetical protein SAMN02745161_1511 [Halodesulfovibrio marinisediminis DSM 17456]